MKIVSIVGARPEFIQAMPVSKALRTDHQEILVHTGQHYDYLMSQKFFDELDIPAPDYNLKVGSATQAEQVAKIIVGLEEVLLKEKPDLVIVRGDTNSTLASALATSKLNIPLAHIEAGERSYNRQMPEEINRVVVDRLANLLFCVSHESEKNLLAEGITESVYFVGDVMLDALKYAQPIAHSRSAIMEKLKIESRHFSLVTIHRANNTDNPERLEQILSAFNQISETIILPLHPRTKSVLSKMNLHLKGNIRIIEPVSYLDMLTLEDNARLIATDSGGVQREAYYLRVPCLTLRDESEWMATIKTGWNKLVGANQKLILENWFTFNPPVNHPTIYGEGNAAQLIGKIINEEGSRQFGRNKAENK